MYNLKQKMLKTTVNRVILLEQQTVFKKLKMSNKTHKHLYW